MAAPAAAAAPVAGVYVAGAALLAGAAWLMTPAGQRASETLGEAIYDGGAQAVDNVKDAANAVMDVFTGDEEETQTTPTTTTTTRECDGPHRGRLQVQGYVPRVDPVPIELSWPWSRPCIPPLRPEGRVEISGLLERTRAISFASAGYRRPAFIRMSQYINSAPTTGFGPHQMGFSIDVVGNAARNRAAGVRFPRNPARVDIEVAVGRAFGDR